MRNLQLKSLLYLVQKVSNDLQTSEINKLKIK